MLFRFFILAGLLLVGVGAKIGFSASDSGGRSGTVRQPTPTPTPRSDQTAWVEGRVFDARTHEPLKGVGVSFEGPDDLFETKTDAAGHYRFEHVAPGDYAYEAGVTGYSDRSNYGWRGAASGPEIHVPASGLKFDIALVHQGRLSGQVRDIQGHPVVGAKVRVYPVNDEVASFEDAVTDKEGRFKVGELDVLHPRKDAIYAVEVSGAKLSRDVKQVRVRPFYNASDEAHVALTMRPRAVISGRVTFRGRPFSEGAVIIDGDEEVPGVATDKDGRYSVSVSAPATYSVTFYGDDVVDQHVQARVLPGRNRVFNRDLKPFPYGSIGGRLVNLKGQPVRGAEIELWTPDTSETEPVAVTDKDGRFFAAKVAPRDDITVSVNMPHGAFRGGVESEVVEVRSYRTTWVNLKGDTIPPRLEVLDAPRVLNGRVTIRFRVSDNEGVRFVSPALDGTWMADDRRSLGAEFDKEKPTRWASGNFGWNSHNARNGRHRLKVEVNDLAGNTSSREWLVWVQGSPTPKAARKPGPVGNSDGSYATNAAADVEDSGASY